MFDVHLFQSILDKNNLALMVLFTHLIQVTANPKAKVRAFAITIIPVGQPQRTDTCLFPTGTFDHSMLSQLGSQGIQVFLVGGI
jgi:hypothetical protein